jgi:crossover junction endodeoxyribonuclease RusA
MITVRPILHSIKIVGSPASLQAKQSRQSWKNSVIKATKICVKKPLEDDWKLELQIDWFSHGRRNKPDVDNIIKPILDALNGILYADDSQVSNVSAKHHDLTNILHFHNEPIQLIQPLLEGNNEYVYVRVYRVH